jgi:sugar phosphate isomerase/epimerase
MTSRRNFLRQAAAAFAAGSITSPLLAGHYSGKGRRIRKIGVQLFSIPKLVEKDFASTMKMLAGIGYKEIEFYGPYSFSAAEDKDRWESVTPSLGFSGSGFFGLTPKQAKNILDDNGLSAPSLHTGLFSLIEAMDPLAEAAHTLGAKYVVLPSAATHPNLDGYKAQADEFNSIGAEASKRGIRFAYHNHGNGLKPLDRTVPFDLIMERTDPKNVFFQMDIFWMTAGGVDVAAYLDRYPGRFRLMHVKDMAKDVRFSGDGGDSGQWIELFPHLTNAGSGVLDLENILSHALQSGVEHFIVERDLAPDPEEDLRKSFSYLNALKLGTGK